LELEPETALLAVCRYLSFHFPFMHERPLLSHLRCVPWNLDQHAFKVGTLTHDSHITCLGALLVGRQFTLMCLHTQ
jgi:hypothetical protein